MDVMQFTHVVPRIKVLETRLIDRVKLDRMIDSSSAQEAIRVLQETEYSSLLVNLKRVEDYGVLLSEELIRVYKYIYKITPVKSVVDILSLKYDYHNLKLFIKEKLLKKDFSNLLIPIGTLDLIKVKYAVENEFYKEISSWSRDSIEETLAVFKSTNDPQVIDIIMDKYMFKEMLSLVKGLDNEFLTKYVKTSIDFTNFKTILRLKKQKKNHDFFNQVLIEGGYVDRVKLNDLFNDSIENIPSKLSSTDYYDVVKQGIDAYSKGGAVNTLEKLSENFIMKILKKAKYVSFGPEPLLGYLVAKEVEIKVIRIIMVGKLNNLTPELIRERLRDLYV